MSNSQLPQAVPAKSSWGKLYGVGVGPGDPELITVKGLRILQRSPLVAFPSGRQGKPGIAQQIVSEWLSPDQPTLALDFPYIQDNEALQQAWDSAASQVLPHLSQGQDVCFVSEGDVSFYSTFSYLAHSVQRLSPQFQMAPTDIPHSVLQTNYPQLNNGKISPAPPSNGGPETSGSGNSGPEIITIPGICSPLTAAAMAGSPLTLRQQKLVILPVLYDATALTQAMAFADVVVLMKIGPEYSKIWSILKEQRCLEQSYIVERASWPQQKIYQHLGDRPKLSLDYFSLWIIPVTESPPPFGNFTV